MPRTVTVAAAVAMDGDLVSKYASVLAEDNENDSVIDGSYVAGSLRLSVRLHRVNISIIEHGARLPLQV